MYYTIGVLNILITQHVSTSLLRRVKLLCFEIEKQKRFYKTVLHKHDEHKHYDTKSFNALETSLWKSNRRI